VASGEWGLFDQLGIEKTSLVGVHSLHVGLELNATRQRRWKLTWLFNDHRCTQILDKENPPRGKRTNWNRLSEGSSQTRIIQSRVAIPSLSLPFEERRHAHRETEATPFEASFSVFHWQIT